MASEKASKSISCDQRPQGQASVIALLCAGVTWAALWGVLVSEDCLTRLFRQRRQGHPIRYPFEWICIASRDVPVIL